MRITVQNLSLASFFGAVFRLEGGAGGICAGGGEARSDVDTRGGTVIVAVVVKTVFDIAPNPPYMLGDVVSEKIRIEKSVIHGLLLIFFDLVLQRKGDYMRILTKFSESEKAYGSVRNSRSASFLQHR